LRFAGRKPARGGGSVFKGLERICVALNQEC
jgi:hypothetical protein